jgi:hypothetical protein
VPHPTFEFRGGFPLVTFTQGTTASNGLLSSILRIGGFSEPIRLSLTGLPFGVTMSPEIEGYEIPGTSTSGSFSYVATNDAAPGPHTLTLHGVSTITGKTASASVPIMVRARGAYTLSTVPSPIAASRTTPLNYTVNITRTGGFSGPVTLATTNFISGLSVGFTPSANTGSTATMTVFANASVAAGTYQFFIRGTSPGADDVELPISIIVPP